MTVTRERAAAVAARPAPARRVRRSGAAFPVHLAMLAWAVVTALPLLWAVVSSFKTDDEILNEPWSLPASPKFDNWSRAWTQASIGRYFLNSVVVVGAALVLTMLLGSLVAYALARYEFRGNRFIYYTFVAAMFFPVFLALVPLFFVVQQLGLLGTYPGLILVYAAYAVPFTVFFLHAFFRTLPSEVAEAAFIDGCSHSGVFFRVMLPMARPGLVAVGIFNFLGLWNQYLLPLVLNPDPDRYVLAQGLAALSVSQGYRSDWSGLFAGLTIAMLPVLVAYVAFQRHIRAGMTAGAVK
ncbi:carbohydrate ABC transporter permease [Micromonospora parathelypteridis]|uniref:N-acetylglucosamine transport system permease protein n=1 Tax=Micromonospora parathelypteridis TaxID=1839617 RepID=A0A840VXM5_9ACTN|nr:carbohydrate ABC transporter permease [Micromonospora parathelypteridis]MBB5480756.1 N-acetylglucosamine transport system permease protein [Micromonospora parathelypteridis]GGO21776.1 sugar ABC transporter permease [Micromonospora parathelypteridis]